MRAKATRIGSLALTVVLAVLGATAGWALLSIEESVAEMSTATTRLDAYASLQRAVAGEAYAEAGYRRAPSPAARDRVESAISAMDEAIAEVRTVGGRTDEAVVSYVTVTNDRYAAEVRTSLDNPTLASDDRVAGPALDSIQALLDGAIEGHREELLSARERQLGLARTLLVVFPIVIAASFIALSLAWRLMARAHGQLLVLSADNEHRSYHDPLTGLANRRLFNDALDKALALKSPTTAVLFIDLDGFKAVNDSLGHDAGDQVLIVVSQRLAESVRGDLVARMGGDEFALVVQPGTDPEALSRRILKVLAAPFMINGTTPVSVSASIGIAEAPYDGQTARELLQRADTALYIAKHTGRGRFARCSASGAGQRPEASGTDLL